MSEKTQPWTDEQRRDIHESVSWMAKQTRQGPDYHTIKAQRDALLEALRTLLSYANTLEMRLLDADGEHRAMQKARAAIKAVEEGK